MSANSRTIFLLTVTCLWLVSHEIKNFVVPKIDTSASHSDWKKPLDEPGHDVNAPFRLDVSYKPSSSEEYAMTHGEELGYLATTRQELTLPSCKLFTDPDLPVHNALQCTYAVCATVDLNLAEIFAQSQQLSYGSFGYAEPLIPPLRHPEFCFSRQYLLTLTYLVHDWKVMCQRLSPFSRTVFIDMGASLVFHPGSQSPAVYILETYQKFGIPFDHVYAYEVTPQEPAQVFQLVPNDLFPSYHWINVGVESDPDSKLNPLRMLLDKYTEEDFVVIKLDIDTSFIEVPLAYQLLNDDRYSKLVDQFYFEHHVMQQELMSSWGSSMEGTLKHSLDLFSGLRAKGIAAHYWV